MAEARRSARVLLVEGMGFLGTPSPPGLKRFLRTASLPYDVFALKLVSDDLVAGSGAQLPARLGQRSRISSWKRTARTTSWSPL